LYKRNYSAVTTEASLGQRRGA